jgi:hypothetical protein
MKKILILVLLLALAAGAYWFLMNGKVPRLVQQNNPDAPYLDGVSQDNSDFETDKFSGKIEQVNTGCFADAECFVVISGRHVTTSRGRTIEPVAIGMIEGVPTVDALESKIGLEVEVYAAKKPDGTYTLEGNRDFYIRLK